MQHSADMVAAEPDHRIPQPFVHDGMRALPDELCESVLLLGNFDGLHMGHRALVAGASEWARRAGRPLAILQLDPHPRHHFRGEQGFLISGSTVQRRLLAEAGIELIYAPRFDDMFAAQPAETFVAEHLVGRLGISSVVTGADFRFGQRRRGDVALLEEMGQANGFAVHVIGECRDQLGDGMRISSSRIRGAIETGHLDEAQRLLGRPFETSVENSERSWRFDPMQILPPDGIFMVEARGAAGRRLGRRMLVLRKRHPEVKLPAGTHTILWHAAASGDRL
ncbi:FAD synthase [Rhizobium sp. CF080]|uniref:FAD synthase n=1 Tax=Rhizobium sp. (strain CF080) TaxID=1144310 RepID=UPI0002717020|nr:FAD synthase [Rhizobium sp. CF080]